jgi:very-short-patch-repair endonuclease
LVPQEPHHRPIAKRIRNFARRMRSEPTDAEAAMWRLMRDRRLLQFKFRRQVPFKNYILDFVCFERKRVIEIDGSQHASAVTDVVRDHALALGLRAIGKTMFCNVEQLCWKTFAQSSARGDRPLTRRLRRHPLPQGRG